MNNKTKRGRRPFLLICLVGVLVGACLIAVTSLAWVGKLGSYSILGDWNPSRRALKGVVLRGDGTQKMGRCILPPETFQESDLIGTWEAEFGTPGNTTLVLREDGTYKQIYDNPDTGHFYESDWQGWWIEYRESGIPNLHMEGMRLCDHSAKDCEREAGGGAGPWFDYCERRTVEMRGEVVLLLVGVSSGLVNPPPRGIVLLYLKPDPDSIARSFQLQE